MSYAQHRRKECDCWASDLNISAVPAGANDLSRGSRKCGLKWWTGAGIHARLCRALGSSVCFRSWWSCSLYLSSFPYLMALVLLATGG